MCKAIDKGSCVASPDLKPSIVMFPKHQIRHALPAVVVIAASCTSGPALCENTSTHRVCAEVKPAKAINLALCSPSSMSTLYLPSCQDHWQCRLDGSKSGRRASAGQPFHRTPSCLGSQFSVSSQQSHPA